MAEPNITISLSVDAQNAAEQVREFVAESRRSIESTFVSATERAQKAIYDLSSKQERLTAVIGETVKKMDDLRQAAEKASSTDKALIEAEITALTRLNAQHNQEKLALSEKILLLKAKGAAAEASTDAEKLAIQIVNQNRLIENSLLKDNQKALEAVAKAQTANAMAADKATAKRITDMENLNRQENEHYSLLARSNFQLAEIERNKSTASGDELKRLNLEGDAVKKVADGHQREIYEIQLKKLAIEEEALISQASSEKEITAIQEMIDKRRMEIGVLKDTSRAQVSMNETVQDGTSALASMARQFLGALGWATGIGAVVQAFRELDMIVVQTREDMEKAEEAAQKFRDLGASIFDKQKALFNEMGITDPGEQQAASATISTLSKKTGVTPSLISSIGASLAPSLKAQGITSISDPRFSDIVGQAGIVADKGISGENIRDFVAQNPGANGKQINQAFSDLAANTGSPAMANTFMDTWQQTKAAAQTAGFTQTDAEKLFVQLKNTKGISPREVPEIMSRYFTSSQRMHGLNRDEQLALMEKLAPDGQGVQPIRNIIQSAINSGKDIDIQAFAKAAGGLSASDQALVDRDVAGPRGVTALMSGAGYQGVQLQTNAPLFAPQTNPNALSEAQKEQAQLDQPQSNNMGGSYLNEAVKLEEDAMDKRVDLYTSLFQDITPGDKVNRATANVQGNLLLQMAQLKEDIGSGKVKATPAQIAKLDRYLQILGSVGSSDAVQALVTGSAGKQTRSGVLGNIHDREKFLRDNIDYTRYTTPDQGGEYNLQNAQQFETDMTTGQSTSAVPAPPPGGPRRTPTTSPVSVNYHQRIVNYGYGFDSVGGQEAYENNMG